MMGNLKEDRLKLIGMIAVVVVVLLVILLMITGRKEDNNVPETQTENEITEDISGNKVVIQSENSQTAEGTNLPADINFALLVPRELSEDNLVGVVDNKQLDTRNVTLKYKVAATGTELSQSLVNSLTDLNWEIERQQADFITATQEDKRVAINIQQVDPTNVYVTVLLNFYDNP